MKSISDSDFSLVPEDFHFDYQTDLTKKLDCASDFDQNLLNEIVLWKINRYAKFSESFLIKINSTQIRGDSLNEDFTVEILSDLLETKGVQLPMASTILRFKNPKIYQIIPLIKGYIES